MHGSGPASKGTAQTGQFTEQQEAEVWKGSVKELCFQPAKESILVTGLQAHEKILNRFGLPQGQVSPCKV